MSLPIALCQMVSGENPEENFAQLKDLFHQARAGAGWILFPENTLFQRERGSTPVQGLTLDHPYFQELAELAQKWDKDLLLGSVALQDSQSLTNASVAIDREGKIQVVYRKIHLFDVEVEGAPSQQESALFAPGPRPELMEVRGWKLGLSICYDLRFGELYAHYARQQVDVLTVPSSFLQPTGQAHWETLLRARAIEGQCYVLAPAQAGSFRHGHSLAVDPWGRVLVEAQTAGPEVLFAQLDLDRIQQVRRQIPMAQHRKEITLKW